MRRLLLLLVGIPVMLSAADPARAATWKVGRGANDCDGPCDYYDQPPPGPIPNGFGIQYCLSRPSTVPGDSVIVWPGTYGAKLLIGGGTPSAGPSNVVLASRYGAATVSIVGAAGGDPGILLIDVGSGTVIDGFTIEWDATSSGIGGAIGAYVSSGVVRNCIIRNCRAGVGSGIYLQTCDLLVENNLLVANNSTSGGGALTISGGAPVARNNTFWSNECPFGQQGASIYATGSSATFDRNIVSSSVGGSAFYCGGTNDGDIICNVFWDNPFGTFGGSCADSVGLGDNVMANPLFCDPGAGDFGVCSDSPVLTGPCGVIGYTSPGGNCGPCLPTPVAQLESRTWAGIKALYRR